MPLNPYTPPNCPACEAKASQDPRKYPPMMGGGPNPKERKQLLIQPSRRVNKRPTVWECGSKNFEWDGEGIGGYLIGSFIQSDECKRRDGRNK